MTITPPNRKCVCILLVPRLVPGISIGWRSMEIERSGGPQRLILMTMLEGVGDMQVGKVGEGLANGGARSSASHRAGSIGHSRQLFVPAPTSSAVASPVVGPEVDEFGLTDAEHGWVLSGGRLYLTADGGRTWTFALDLADPRSIPLITFVDAQHGWLVPFRSTEDGPAIVQRTADGGQTWQQATIPSVYGIPGGLVFFDSGHGVLAFDGWNGKSGSLWSTSDGGATWAKVASLPVAIVGAVSFSDGGKSGWALAASEPQPAGGQPADE